MKAVVQRLVGSFIRGIVQPVVPLQVRQQWVVRIGQWPLLGSSFLSRELLADFAQQDPINFHHFLWSQHIGGLGYGKTYEISERFGDGNIRLSRRDLLGFVKDRLRRRGLVPEEAVTTVFDVGCSLGYVLRFLETDAFPSATCLRGMDVDRYAIETGAAHLRGLGSKVELRAGDIRNLQGAMGPDKYDLVLCCGVLMYLDEAAATQAISTMLRHTRMLLAIIAWANLEQDNSEMTGSQTLADQTFLHNVDVMVAQAGGRVVFRKWTGADPRGRYSHKQPLFVLAEP